MWKYAAASIALTAIVIVAFMLTRRGDGGDDRVADEAEPAMSTAGEDPCLFEVGQEASYHITEEIRFELDVAPLTRSLQTGASRGVRATGTQTQVTNRMWSLNTHVWQASEVDAVIAVGLTTQASAGDTEESTLGDSIQAPALVRISNRCEILGLAYVDGSDPRSVLVQQSVLAALNFVFPPEGRTTAVLFDSTGTYEALARGANDGALLLRNLKYRELFSEESPDEVQVEQSLIRVVRGANAWFESLYHSRKLDFSIEGVTVAHLDLVVTADTAEGGGFGLLEEVESADWTWALLFGEQNEAPENGGAAAVEAQSWVAELDFDAMLEEIAFRLETGGDPTIYIDDLVAWIRANPDKLGQIHERIHTEFFDDRQRLRAAMFLGLQVANTPESRQLLLDIFADVESPYGYRMQAAQVLSQLQPAPPGYLDSLLGNTQAMEGSDRGGMQLAVGTFARFQRELDPAGSTRAEDSVIEWLGSAAGRNQTLDAIHSAENAASDRMLDAVRPFMTSENQEFRYAAAESLSSMTTETAISGAASVLANETSANVRTRLFRSIDESMKLVETPLPAEAVNLAGQGLSEATGEMEYDVRVQLLSRAAENGDSDARQLIEQAFSREMSQTNRNHDRLESLGRALPRSWSNR